jgi:hypothetical protein
LALAHTARLRRKVRRSLLHLKLSRVAVMFVTPELEALCVVGLASVLAALVRALRALSDTVGGSERALRRSEGPPERSGGPRIASRESDTGGSDPEATPPPCASPELRGKPSLSETSSGWRLTENRAMLLFNEGSFQAHCLGGCRSIAVAGSTQGGDLDIAAANKRSVADCS